MHGEWLIWSYLNSIRKKWKIYKEQIENIEVIIQLWPKNYRKNDLIFFIQIKYSVYFNCQIKIINCIKYFNNLYDIYLNHI